MEATKRRKYEDLAALHDLTFTPAVWDAFGAAGPGARRVLRDAAAQLVNKRHFERPNWAASSPEAYFKQLISIKLQKTSAVAARRVRYDYA